MDVRRTVDAVRRHLDRHGYADVEIRDLSGYPASQTRFSEDVVQCLLAAHRAHGCEPEVWPLVASATPYYQFDQVLGIPHTWGGLGRAGGSHSVD